MSSKTRAAIKRWMKDSKIVDAKGQPLLMWHGTTKKFDRFDVRYLSPSGAYGPGFYFTNDYELAKDYSNRGEPISAYLSLKSPWTQIYGTQRQTFRGMAGRLEEMGFDGVLVIDGDYVEAVALHPSQILRVS